jgi:DNA polymerase
LIVPLVAPFFRDRFGVMRWTILTPDASVSWDGRALTFGDGVPQREAPQADDLEAMWKTYYASVFNPARIKLDAMRAEMPKKHWPTLPETEIIDDLLRDAPRRMEEMMARQRQIAKPAGPGMTPNRTAGADSDGLPLYDACPVGTSAAEFIPQSRSLKVLAEACQACQGCPIYCRATQAVFGEGPKGAAVMFVGEQPGDQEDLAGKPFVGPSGQLLSEAMEQGGVPRDETYVTNAVKHFKWEPRGKRRLHSKPSAREVAACRPWLETEISIVKPQMIVCLGATAAQSLLGSGFRITQHRGEVLKTDWAPWLLATNHPSAVLRVPDAALREKTRAAFFEDLRVVGKKLKLLRER